MENILNQTLLEALKYLKNLESGIVAPQNKALNVESIPKQGIGAEAALEKFLKKYEEYMVKSAGPRYFGFVIGGVTPAALAGDWLTSVFDQDAFGIKGNVDEFIEKEAIKLLKQLLGINSEFQGTFVSGATMANFVSLAIARQWGGKKTGVNVAKEGINEGNKIKIASCSPHSSIYKSLSMLGLGRNSLNKIECLKNREAVDPEALELFLSENKNYPVIYIANLGTVNTGDFDELEKIVKLKDKYDFWIHVDAAFAGIADCSEKYKHLFKGIEEVDSITIDTHKWLNTPYDGAVQLSKHLGLQNDVFTNDASYLDNSKDEPEIFNLTPENSRRMRALPVWFTLMAYGKAGYSEIIERNCYIAEEFGRRINQSKYFRLLANVKLNVVCFTLNTQECELTGELINNFLKKLRQEGGTFLTSTNYKGIPAIRIAVSNWSTTFNDMEVAFNSLFKVAENFLKTP